MQSTWYMWSYIKYIHFCFWAKWLLIFFVQNQSYIGVFNSTNYLLSTSSHKCSEKSWIQNRTHAHIIIIICVQSKKKYKPEFSTLNLGGFWFVSLYLTRTLTWTLSVRPGSFTSMASTVTYEQQRDSMRHKICSRYVYGNNLTFTYIFREVCDWPDVQRPIAEQLSCCFIYCNDTLVEIAGNVCDLVSSDCILSLISIFGLHSANDSRYSGLLQYKQISHSFKFCTTFTVHLFSVLYNNFILSLKFRPFFVCVLFHLWILWTEALKKPTTSELLPFCYYVSLIHMYYCIHLLLHISK